MSTATLTSTSTTCKPQAGHRAAAQADFTRNIVLNTDFAGGWADSTWTSSGCSAYGDSAVDFVASNPAAMANAYWAGTWIVPC